MTQLAGRISADTAPAANATARTHVRGDERLYPPRHSGRYYVLTVLRREIEAIAQEHLSDCGDQTLVDFGCGDAPYRPLLSPRVGRYLAVDLPGNAIADVPLQADGHVPLADGSAGIVLSSQVLEHVPDPAAYLAECRRLLKPGGKLIVSTHGIWKYHPHPADLWRWTGEGLRRAVVAHGFTIERFRGLLGLGATSMLLAQDAVIVKLPRRLRPPMAWVMQWLIAAGDRLHDDEQRARDGSVYLLVATRTQEDRP